jgi:adenylate cyclase
MTSSMSKLRFYGVLFSVCYWMLAGFYFVAIRFLNIEFAPPDLDYGDLAIYAGGVGSCIGLFFGLFPIGKILRLKKRRTFASAVLIGTVSYMLFFITVIFLTSLIGNTPQFALHYVFSEGLVVLFHLSMSSLLYHFILQINTKFGPGILLEYAVGKYFAPKVEERAFMFLDLKSSTQLAEKLEHVSYSRLIQDCYAELTEPLMTYNAEVYQYVGDEVVITWRMTNSFSVSNCHEFAFAFQNRLDARKEYFAVLYGVKPEFKAGIHCGRVTVAEVGEVKTEIAYHGDVLNTAARIQSLCNKFEKHLLLSETVVALLPEKERAKTILVAEAELRGKEGLTKIFTIESPTTLRHV